MPSSEEPVREEPLDVYANQVSLLISALDVTMVFGLMTDPGRAPKETVRIRMSPQHALIFSRILQKNMAAYQEQVGRINLPGKLYESLGLEAE